MVNSLSSHGDIVHIICGNQVVQYTNPTSQKICWCIVSKIGNGNNHMIQPVMAPICPFPLETRIYMDLHLFGTILEPFWDHFGTIYRVFHMNGGWDDFCGSLQ